MSELTLRATSKVVDLIPPQASRVLRRLVGLGVVERRDVPPAALFKLARENLAARFVSELARLREVFLDELRRAVAGERDRVRLSDARRRRSGQ